MRAERDRRAAILEAEGQKQARILESEGVKDAQINQAEGDKQARIMSAEAEAQARLRVAEAEGQAILRIAEAVRIAGGDPTAYLLGIRYIDAFREINAGSDTKTIYMPYEASAMLGALGGLAQMMGKGANPNS